MTQELLAFNGIDGHSDNYVQPPISLEALASSARKAPVSFPEVRGLKFDVEPGDLESAGWGIIFPPKVDPRIRQALEPLIEHRRREATAKDPKRFKEYTYLPGEDKRAFLSDRGVLPAGPVDPARVPYYLLIVGDPGEAAEIPFSFQYELGIQYAVGRVFFESPEEYERYARSVIEEETSPHRRKRRAHFFSTQHRNDSATAMALKKLVRPLHQSLHGKLGWNIDLVEGAEANKKALEKALLSDPKGALLFTVSHGVAFRKFDDPLKRTHQGALILSDWPGPKSGQRSSTPEYCFTAADVDQQADLRGKILFHLACWSAGTPQHDYFDREVKRTAERDFVALLPQRLLAHEKGGALAVVGHVDCAWFYSFLWDDIAQPTLFESALGDLMRSFPVGHAMRYFGEYYAEVGRDLLDIQEEKRKATDKEYLKMWISYKDAGSYVILGDPACRLSLPEPAP